MQNGHILSNRLKTAVQMQGIRFGVGIRFSQLEGFYYFIGEFPCYKIHGRPIGPSGNIIGIIGAGVSAYKNILVPWHNVPTLYMDFGRGINDLVLIDSVQYIFDSLELFFPIGEYICLYQLILDHKSNIPRKYLIAVP